MHFIHVTVDYKVAPIGIDNERPLFGWKYAQSENAIQKSYRVVVSSSVENMEKSCYDLWDSGEVFSSTQLGVEYAGQKLCSGQVCFVRVFAKDLNGESCVSNVTSFEMGLLDDSDWQGRWISMPTNFQGGALSFRKLFTFPTDKEIVRARVYLCAFGYHELYFNGKKVGDYLLHPPLTDYSKTVTYTTYDVTEYIGKNNAMGVLVGHGWLGDRKLLAQINIYYKDGTVFSEGSNYSPNWWVSGSPIINDSIYGGETYDARLESIYKDWSTPEYNATNEKGWILPLLTPALTGKKRAMDIEPIRVVNAWQVKSVVRMEDGKYLIDTGLNVSGWLKITATGRRGDKMTVRYAEDVKDGKINTLNLRSAKSTDCYIFAGIEEETYSPRFTYHGFRYVEIETDGEVVIKDVTCEIVRSDVKAIGEFECDDEIVNALHRNAVLTESNNLHSIMTDCPQRDERFGWLNDLTARIFQTVNNFSMENFFPKVIDDITDTQNKFGQISDTAPHYTGGIPADPVCVCYLLLALDCYRLYGNKQIIAKRYANLKGWTDSLMAMQKGYVLDFTIYGDWVCPYKDVRANGVFISTAYLYWHLRCTERLALICEKTSDAEKYKEHAENCKKVILEKFFDGKNFSGGTQGDNSIALSLGLCEQERVGKVAKRVADDIISRGYHSTCGNQSYRHMFYALADQGYNDLLLETLINPEYPGWGYMVHQGATTVWERWEKEMGSEMHSFNHPMFGSYDGWLYNKIAGINIPDDAQGADKLVIQPLLTEKLNRVSASIETLRGTVRCSYQKTDGRVSYKITVPTNTTAKIILQGKVISVNGKPVKSGDLTVNSGVYKIETENL